MNLVKLYTRHDPLHVDTDELARGRKLLTVYTSRGNRLKDVGKTKEIRMRVSYGVHRDNLFASQELADAASDRIWHEIFGKQAMSTKQLRADCRNGLSTKGSKNDHQHQ